MRSALRFVIDPDILERLRRELRRAVEEKGDSCVIVSGEARFSGRKGGARTGAPAESFRLAPEKISGKQAVRVSASDNRGLIYAITELADRVRHATNPVAALTLAAPLEEPRPKNQPRIHQRCRG